MKFAGLTKKNICLSNGNPEIIFTPDGFNGMFSKELDKHSMVRYNVKKHRRLKMLHINGKYRHYKGNLYEVVGVARHSETLEEMVVYRALYGDGGLWVRPLGMFCENITIDGKTVPRFAYVED